MERVEDHTEILNHLEDMEDDHALKMDGFDDAIIGQGMIAGNIVLLYDQSKVISMLQDQGLSYADAWEHYAFNIASGYLGSGTPVMVEMMVE